ncbi:MAG: FixH family protein [Betaproteobacteria bacterium]|nr:FixH family protein [Betaproteobacteria bacterium]
MTGNVQTLDTMPWYKYPWPWFLFGLPAIVVIAGFYTLFLAKTSFDGMVEDDYYKRGLGINHDIARDHKAADLGLTAEAMIGRGEARVFLESTTGMAFPENLVLHFRYATRAGMDQAVLLTYDGSFYAGSMEQLVPGKWRLALENVALEDTDDAWRILGNFDPAIHESVRLVPSVPAAPSASAGN